MLILYYYLLVISFLSFFVMGYDKYMARNNKRRIAENNLLLWTLFGGSIGTGLGMWVFKHKTSKRSFLWKFWSIVILQFLIVLALFYTNTICIY